MEAVAEKAKQTLWNKNFILILIANWMLCTSFSMVNPCFSLYAQSQGISTDVAGAIIGIATIISMFMRPVSGNLADKKNKKYVVSAALLISALAAFLYNFAYGATPLMFVRIIQGIGFGIYTTLSSTIVFDSVPSGRMAEGIGIFGLGAVFAMAIGPYMGLALVKSGSFHTLFITAGFLTVISLILTLNMDAAMFIVKQRSKVPITKKYIMDSLIEAKAIPAAIIAIMISMTYNSIISFVSLYAEYRGIVNIGIFFTVYAGVLLISRPLSGRISDQKGASYVLIPGLISMLLSTLILYFAAQLNLFLLAAVFFGIGFGCSLPTTQAMAAKNVPANRRGSAMSTFYIGADFGLAAGGALAGFLAKAVGYENMYLSLSLPTFIGFLIFILFLRKRIS